MLNKQKEYWRQRAREEYLQADNDAKAQEDIEQNQFDYNKKVREHEWVFKGLTSTNDRTLQERLEIAKTKQHTRKYGEIDIDAPQPVPTVEEVKKDGKKETKMKSWFGFLRRKKSGDDDSVHSKISSGHSVFDDYSVNNVKLRYSLLDGKQEQAHAMYVEDNNQKRFGFLKENYERIVVLRRVKTWLSVEKQPAHQTSAIENLPGFVPAKHLCVLTEEEKDRLRCSVPVIPPESIIETLKPLEQVIAEENQANRFRVGGMHHRYLGADKLYPMKEFPSTIEVLLPPFSGESKIPEHHLLPNPEREARKLAEKEAAMAAQREKRRQVRRLRKGRIDLSRILCRPTTAPQLQSPNELVSLSALESVEQDLERTFGPSESEEIVPYHSDVAFLRYNNDPRHKKTSSIRRRNQQFRWRSPGRAFADSSKQGGSRKIAPIEEIFVDDSQELTVSVIGNESYQDQDKTGGTKSYDEDSLQSPPSSPFKPNTDMHEKRVERSVASVNSSRLGTGKHFHVGILDEDERPQTAPVHGSSWDASLPMMMASQEQLAMRSNVLATTSFVPDRPLIRIKLPKYSKYRDEKKLKIRGNLKMISLRTKEKLFADRSVSK